MSAISEQTTLYPEDGGRRFLKTLGTLLPKYMVPHPTKPRLHNHYHENLKSHITETSFIPFWNNSLCDPKCSNWLIQSEVTLYHPFIEIWTLPFILCHAFVTSHGILKANDSALKVWDNFSHRNHFMICQGTVVSSSHTRIFLGLLDPWT